MREDLPTGTVTFLFTDVEGSTRLLHELGPEGYAEALLEHRWALRAVFSRHEGVEVDTQGDAFFVAFPTAAAAVAAAEAGQVELASGQVMVRMGLHTGMPHLTEEGYVGEDVHLGARVAAVGHGGQVLLSAATHDLVDVDGLDLGEHRLKDFDRPVAIFQLGSEPFPPLKTISNTNLPTPASSFVGREQEVADVTALVRDARLVTLTGPGGTGKTRLAIDAAWELVGSFKAGVFWVGLATVRDPALVVETVAQTLGGKQDLAAHVGERELLLLLDNFEQVVDAAPGLSALLEACPNLRFLVTSRELLRIQGEVEYGVPPLGEPEAVELFCARSRLEEDEAVHELCRRLDNLPLAVELAAARTAVLRPEQILARLGQRLDLLKGGRDADPRQQTLRATIEWSYELLSEEEQRVFAGFAAFDGGATLVAIEEITHADLDTLASLVDKSLVRRTEDRFWMLETIREFASELLERTGAANPIGRAHAEHFLALGESADLTAESDHRERPELVRPELGNFRRAIDWALGQDLELAFRLAISLELFWVIHDPFEGARRFSALLERGSEVSPVLRARALRVHGETAFTAGDFALGTKQAEQSLFVFEELGDEPAVAVLRHRLGVSAFVAGDVSRARQLLEASLAACRAYPDPRLEADLVRMLGSIEQREGNPERALELLEEAVQRCEHIGHDWLQAAVLLDVAELKQELGSTEAARVPARESLRLARELDDRQTTVYALAWLARLAAAGGHLDEAGRLWGAIEAEESRGPIGTWERDREEFAGHILAADDSASEEARAAGRRLSLDEAAAATLAVDSPS